MPDLLGTECAVSSSVVRDLGGRYLPVTADSPREALMNSQLIPRCASTAALVR